MHFCATYKMANFPARTGYRKYDISVAPDALMPYQFFPILVWGGRLALESKNQVVERRKRVSTRSADTRLITPYTSYLLRGYQIQSG